MFKLIPLQFALVLVLFSVHVRACWVCSEKEVRKRRRARETTYSKAQPWKKSMAGSQRLL